MVQQEAAGENPSFDLGTTTQRNRAGDGGGFREISVLVATPGAWDPATRRRRNLADHQTASGVRDIRGGVGIGRVAEACGSLCARVTGSAVPLGRRHVGAPVAASLFICA